MKSAPKGIREETPKSDGSMKLHPIIRTNMMIPPKKMSLRGFFSVTGARRIFLNNSTNPKITRLTERSPKGSIPGPLRIFKIRPFSENSRTFTRAQGDRVANETKTVNGNK